MSQYPPLFSFLTNWYQDANATAATLKSGMSSTEWLFRED
jgi:hypothetical protein